MKAPTDQHSLERLSEIFAHRTGHEPVGFWRAPGRVNLIGEHTDYSDGFVLPMAVNRQTIVAGRARPDDVWRMWSLQQDGEAVIRGIHDLEPGAVSGWPGYVAGTGWAISGGGSRLTGADLLIDSDVPLGAGLSSSAALEVASGLALAELSGVSIDRKDLALHAQKAENYFVGVPCGIMDQMVSAMGRRDHALFLDTRTQRIEHVPFNPSSWGATLVVIDTRTSHSLADGEYGARRKGCEEAARSLGIPALRDLDAQDLPGAFNRLSEDLIPLVRHVVTENERVTLATAALKKGDPGEMGRNMNASHESLRSDFRVSSPELDLAVDVSRMAGAYGSRMTGGGFGGSAIALVDGSSRDAVRAAVEEAFVRRGWETPGFLDGYASSGALRG